jgi:hypothetical protein
MGSLQDLGKMPDGIQADRDDINPSYTESASNSVFRPGAGVAQYPDLGFLAFIW